MTLHIVPSLSTMVETSLAAILRAKDRRAFERAFDEFVADDASIAMNGQPVARSHYREHLWQEQMGEQAAEVRFKEVVEVPDDAKAVIQVRCCGSFPFFFFTVFVAGSRGVWARRAKSGCFMRRRFGFRRVRCRMLSGHL